MMVLSAQSHLQAPSSGYCNTPFTPGRPLLSPHPQSSLILCHRQRGQVTSTGPHQGEHLTSACHQMRWAVGGGANKLSCLRVLRTHLPWGPKSPMMYMVCTGVLMTWLFLMNSSEGSQVTMRDFRAFPSLPIER